jgi:hypothetical protein
MQPFDAAIGITNDMQRRLTINLLESVLLATILPTVCGCSTESWKRTGYETLQNVRQQQCEKSLSETGQCGERKSYETYRREVEELEAERASDHN